MPKLRNQMGALAFAALSCAVVFGAPEPLGSPPPLTLKEAVGYAVENAPALKAVAGELAVAGAEKKKAFAAFLPQIDARGSQGLMKGGSQRLGSSASLTMTENIFDSGISILNYDSSHLKKEIAELAFKNSRDQLALSVAQQFARLSLNRNLLEVQEKQYEIVRKQHQNIEALYKQGVKTRKDYLRFTTEMRRSEIELVNARIAIDRAGVELKRLMGRMADGRLESGEFAALPVDYKSIDHLPVEAPDITSHYRYRIAALQSEVFSNDATVARRKFWPQLGLTAEAVHIQDDYLSLGRGFSGGSGSQWSLLATIQFNLMDWGIRRQDMAIADQRKIVQEQQIKDHINTFVAENQNLMLSLKQSHSNFKLSKELLDLETKTYDFLQMEYQNGKVTYLDLIVGLRDLLSAKVKLFTSYFELQELLFQYRYHQGQLYETIQQS